MPRFLGIPNTRNGKVVTFSMTNDDVCEKYKPESGRVRCMIIDRLMNLQSGWKRNQPQPHVLLL